MMVNALQHIHQIGVGGQVVQFAGVGRALDDTLMLSPQFCPAEQPVFLALGIGRWACSRWLVVRLDFPRRPLGSLLG